MACCVQLDAAHGESNRTHDDAVLTVLCSCSAVSPSRQFALCYCAVPLPVLLLYCSSSRIASHDHVAGGHEVAAT